MVVAWARKEKLVEDDLRAGRWDLGCGDERLRRIESWAVRIGEGGCWGF
jgi:hypothetical protein